MRDQKIMLDRDLAELFGAKPIRLREQVKRNRERFPENFTFVLTESEVEIMVSQNAIPSKQALGGALPHAFTEHGILMLSNVIKNPKAVQISIRIIEIFIKLREMLLTQKDLLLIIEQTEKKILDHDQKIQMLFNYLKRFIERRSEKMAPIGFTRKNES